LRWRHTRRRCVLGHDWLVKGDPARDLAEMRARGKGGLAVEETGS
jgi:hypothetical protein